MHTPTHAHHAFDMLIDPRAILEAVEASDRLCCLRRKVCRPLDKPLIPKSRVAPDVAAFDAEVDRLVGSDPE